MIKDFVVKYLEGLKQVMETLPIENMDKIASTIFDAYKKGCRIFIMGNGGSGATSSHFVCDLNKGVSVGLKKRFRAISLNDNIPIMLAYANDRSYQDIFAEQLENFLEPGDIVIGISATGNSRNILKAIEYANKKGVVTIGLAGFDGGKLAGLAKVALTVKTKDMQKVEDLHLIITHIIMQYFWQRLH